MGRLLERDERDGAGALGQSARAGGPQAEPAGARPGTGGVLVVVSLPLGKHARPELSGAQPLVAPGMAEDYAAALAREAASVAPDLEGRRASCVALAGGLVDLMPARSLARVLEAVDASIGVEAGAEVWLRAPAGRVGPALFEELRAMGVSRFTLGYLSTRNLECAPLEPPYDVADLGPAVDLMRQRDFREFDVEVGLGLPRQTERTLLSTLLDVADEGPVGVRVRPLVVERGSRLAAAYAARGAGRVALPGPSERAAMARGAREMLGRYRYRHAGAGWFAFPGHEPRGLSHLLAGGDYVGLGAGARSLVGGFAWRDTADARAYIAHADDPEAVCEQAGPLGREGLARARAAAALSREGGASAEELLRGAGDGGLAEALAGLESAGLVRREGEGAAARWVKTDLGAQDPAAFSQALGAALPI